MKARTVTLAGLTARLVEAENAPVGASASGASSSASAPLVILLHGFGAPGDDLVSLADALSRAPAIRALPPGRAPRFLFPHAPLDLGPEYAGGRAWWMIDMMAIQLAAMRGQTIDRSADVPEGLAPSRARMLAFLDEAKRELGVRGEDLVIGGFSQGSMIACDAALHTTAPLAGLMVLSGTLLAASEWGPRFAARGSASGHALPVFQSHGDADPILPFAQAEALRARFVAAGNPVTWVPFHGGHGIGSEVLAAAAVFLAKVLAPSASSGPPS